MRKWGARVRRQQRFFGQFKPRTPERPYVAGETHLYLGRQYRFRTKGLIVRQMEKRWGSPSPSGRLLLNRRLIEAPVDTIDPVIAHELCLMAE